jgi:hypothetical protein
MHCKVGTRTRAFLAAFVLNEKYMKQVPIAPMLAPSFMWRGVYEQRALSCPIGKFWSFLEESEMVKNCFDPSNISVPMESLIHQKILDVSSQAEDTHSNMRKLFPIDLVYPKSLSSNAIMQIGEVKFAVQYKRGADTTRVNACEKVLNCKDNKIANAMLSFPHGRAILATVILAAEQHGSRTAKATSIIKGLTTMVAEFPRVSSLDEFSKTSAAITSLMTTFDADSGKDMAELCALLLPHFDNLWKAVRKYYMDIVGPVFVNLDSAMEFAKNTAGIDKDIIKKMSVALLCFDKAHALSGNKLLPMVYTNMRAMGNDIKGLLVDSASGEDAIAGEFFDVALAGAVVATSTSLHADKFRGAFGDLLDWKAFINKYNASDIVKKSREILTKDVQPSVDGIIPNVKDILKITDIKGLDTESAMLMQLMASEEVEKQIENVDFFAAKAGDVTLRAQLGKFRCLMNLAKSVGDVKRWQLSAKTPEACAFTDTNIPIVSKLRIAVRNASFDVASFTKLFKPEPDPNHLINDFDDEKYAEDLAKFVELSANFLEEVQGVWRKEFEDLVKAIERWIPEWTPETLLEASVCKRLLENANFNALGSTSSQLLCLLELHKLMS